MMPKTPQAEAANPGRALREIRNENRWTLAEVSARTGLPISTLSKVENGKLSLSYDKLVRISQGLGIDIARLFSTDLAYASAAQATGGRRIVTRAGEGQEIVTDNYRHIFPAAELLHRRFNPIVAELKANSIEEFGELIRHEGEEFTYVVSGSVDFYSDAYAPTRLEIGDAVYFDSRMGHAYIRASKGVCRIVTVCTAETLEIAQPAAPTARPRGQTPPAKIAEPVVVRAKVKGT